MTELMEKSAHVARTGPATLIDLVGRTRWTSRLAELRSAVGPGLAGRAFAQRHALELTVDRLSRNGLTSARLTEPEQRVAVLAEALSAIPEELTAAGRVRFEASLEAALTSNGCLVGLFHLARIASTQRERGFQLRWAGFDEGAPYDLLIACDGVEAEIAAEVVSAEQGRDVHRGAWVRLVDRIDPDLQQWLAAHPGRYLLKMTLPRGLRGAEHVPDDAGELAQLHGRITRLLAERRRAEYDEAAVLRLDPLLVAAAQADAPTLMGRLRREFGPEAHLAVTACGEAVFVMAARAGRADEVAEAMHRRMVEIAPRRLTGTRPGILAMFVEDTDRVEWRSLRDQLRLEGEARQFLTRPEANAVVAVTCASRFELYGCPPPDAAPGGELRFRNPRHHAAKIPALAPSVVSSA